MFDGFKILVGNECTNHWLASPYLVFASVFIEKTGEIKDHTKWASFQGLKFIITQSEKHPQKPRLTLRGSFHRYFNKGKDNANDFAYTDFLDVLKDIETRFKIDLSKARIQNLEYGVNLLLDTKVSNILKGIKAYKNKPFVKMQAKDLKLGYHHKTQRTEIKIYDKGKQAKKTQNILRIEIKALRNETLAPQIKTLADLKDPTKVLPLGQELAQMWQTIIYYDKGIQYKEMSQFEKAKFLRFIDRDYWSGLSTKQRWRSKKHFRQLLADYGTYKTQSKITTLIRTKWHELTANKCPRLEQDFEKIAAPEMSTFGTFKYSFQTWTKPTKTKPMKSTTKTIKRTCQVCSKSIDKKRPQAKYCSKKCNNHLNGKRRTEKRRSSVLVELEQLDKLLLMLSQNVLWLNITYIKEGGIFTDQLHQSEIYTTYKMKIRKVHILEEKKEYNLTTVRAKTLIRSIIAQNSKTRHQSKENSIRGG